MMASTVIVVAFEVWPWPALGCYGHDWIATPGWDAFAAEGFVFDRAVALPIESARAAALEQSKAAGIETILLTEAGLVPWSGPWDHQQTVTGDEHLDAPWSDHPATQVFQSALEALQQTSDRTRLIIIQARGWVPGLAPSRAALELYAEDFADDGIDISAIPDEDLAASTVGRATRISLLDHGVSTLAEALSSRTEPTWCAIIAQQGTVWLRLTRSVELPEAVDPQRLLVPFVVWSSDAQRRQQPGRSAAPVSTADLWPSVTTWLGLSNPVSHDACDLTPLIEGRVRGVHDRVTQPTAGWQADWTLDDLTLTPTDAVLKPQRFHLPEDQWALCDIIAPPEP